VPTKAYLLDDSGPLFPAPQPTDTRRPTTATGRTENGSVRRIGPENNREAEEENDD
jgi:hypothetical protein